MRGWYKAKETYKDIPEDESYKCVAFRKHDALLGGDVVYLETAPRLMNKDFGEYLEACDDPSESEPEVEEAPPEVAEEVVEEAPPEVEETPKSAEPSDEWTKDELKAYMDANYISYNSGDTKADLVAKCSAQDEGDE